MANILTENSNYEILIEFTINYRIKANNNVKIVCVMYKNNALKMKHLYF